MPFGEIITITGRIEWMPRASLIEIKNFQVTAIKELDAMTQSR